MQVDFTIPQADIRRRFLLLREWRICSSEKIDPSWVALLKSRGIESESHKLFMRLSVLVSMWILYIPAIVAFVYLSSCDQKVFLSLILEDFLRYFIHLSSDILCLFLLLSVENQTNRWPTMISHLVTILSEDLENIQFAEILLQFIF